MTATTHQQIFVNLPVRDVPRSRRFFAALGYAFDEKFSNEQALAVELGPNLYAMLLDTRFFAGFTKKPLADAREVTEVLVCVSCDSRAHVDELVAKAVQAGAKTPNPKQDYGFMYSHGYEDLDGHVWELVYMDPNATPPQA